MCRLYQIKQKKYEIFKKTWAFQREKEIMEKAKNMHENIELIILDIESSTAFDFFLHKKSLQSIINYKFYDILMKEGESK